MKKTFFLLFCFCLVGLLGSCTKDQVEDLTENETDGGSSVKPVEILSESAIAHISEEVISDSLVVFDTTIPDDLLPKEGSHLFIPISEKTPYGFLGRVTKIEKGASIKVFTETLPLEEVFETMSVDTSINVMNQIESVIDADGNLIDFERVDTVLVDENSSRASNYWNGNVIKLSMEAEGVKGDVIVGVDYFDFDMDISLFKIKYINMTLKPVLGMSTNLTWAKDKVSVENKKLLGTFFFAPITIPTPIGIPLILRPKLYLYFVAGAEGEISLSTSVSISNVYDCGLYYKNGQWEKVFDYKNSSLNYNISSIDMKGVASAGLKGGLFVGFYSATTGAGISVTPQASISAEAALEDKNLLITNPSVMIEGKIVGDLYFTASIFKLPIKHYTFSTPEYTIWSKKLYLFPQIEDFAAVGTGTTGLVDYKVDSYSVLGLLGAKVGTGVFESDMYSVNRILYPSPYNIDNRDIRYYEAEVDDLYPGMTYYAAPAVAWGPFVWIGEMKPFTTEATYRLNFRCSNQSYDVISFDFSLNNATGNVIDYITEATDYGGGLMRVHISASYNSETGILEGTFDFYFYEDPDQKRVDSFSVSLANDDSGYVDCNKVVNNGGCYAALRIYKINSRTTRSANIYSRPLIEDDCNVGIYNKNYSK